MSIGQVVVTVKGKIKIKKQFDKYIGEGNFSDELFIIGV
jgi:hypothetical protein